MTKTLRDKENQKKAIYWWVNRFIEQEQARNFVLLRNGWEEKDLNVTDTNLKWRRDRYTRYDIRFMFEPRTGVLQVQPLHELARWTSGSITLDDEGYFKFQTLPLEFGEKCT